MLEEMAGNRIFLFQIPSSYAKEKKKDLLWAAIRHRKDSEWQKGRHVTSTINGQVIIFQT